jgi:hypothetical protein
VKDLSPTQFAIGKAAVRTGHIYKKLSKDTQKLHDYLRVRPVPIVVRKHRFYLLDQDVLAGKHSFDVNEHGVLEVTDDGKEVLEEALFLVTSPEARGLPGFRGPAS